MRYDREIKVDDDIGLLVLNAGKDKDYLSTDLRLHFPYVGLDRHECHVIAHTEFVIINQATKAGIVSPTVELRVLTESVSFPVELEGRYKGKYEDGLNWVSEGTENLPRSFAFANKAVNGEYNVLLKEYIRAYLESYMRENLTVIDEIANSMQAMAILAFDPRLPGGEWRLGGNRSVTLYAGNDEAIRKMGIITHPGQLANSVHLL